MPQIGAAIAFLVAGFIAGYVLGAYRQREFIKRQISHQRWDWAR